MTIRPLGVYGGASERDRTSNVVAWKGDTPTPSRGEARNYATRLNGGLNMLARRSHRPLAHGRTAQASAALFLVACAVLSPAFAQPAATPESVAPSVYTPPGIVDEIMQLARVGPGDYVVDLGSGDGRLVIAAVAKYKARGGFGVDISPMMVTLSNENAAKAGVGDRVRFYERDLFAADISEATVVTVYLLPSIMGKVEKKLLAELKPGARVVVHDFPFPSWPPDKVIAVNSQEKIATTGFAFTQLYVYTVPAKR